MGLKLWRIDSDSAGAHTASRRDRQREEDERWRKTSVMKWKKLSVGSDVYAATFVCAFLCVCVSETRSL